MKLAVYSTKQYDKKYLQQVNESFGFELEFFDFLLTEKTAKTANGCEAVCIFVNDDGSRPVLEELKKHGVKYIALRCAGFNNVDLDAAKELGLKVVRVPAYDPEAVAEHAIGMMTTLNRRIHRAYQRTRDANFSLEGLTGFTMYGKTAGVIGTGKIGVAMLRILKGFGMRLLAFDPYPSAAALELGVEYVDLPTLFSESDVISLHIPATEQTKGSIGYDLLMSMPKGATLVNTARKEVIDEAGLVRAMTEREDLKYITDIAADAQPQLAEKFGKRVFATAKKMGAETAEANVNAGLAAANQVVDFLKNGNRRFQVNK